MPSLDVLRRIFAAQPVAVTDWDDLLQTFHRERAGVTAQVYSNFRNAGGNSYEAVVREVARLAPDARDILDIGCGNGVLLEAIAKRLPAAHLRGVDYAPEEVDQAAVRVPEAEIMLANAAVLPIPSGRIDAVVSHLALMLVRPIESALTEIARVLRSRGLVVAAVDAPASDSAGPGAQLHRRAIQYACELLEIRPAWPRASGAPNLADVLRSHSTFDSATLSARRETFFADLPVAQAVNFYLNLYLIAALPDDLRAALARRLQNDAEAIAQDGYVRMAVSIDIISVQRM